MIVSQGVELILSMSFDHIRADKATNGESFLKLLQQTAYDLVIMDINLPDTNTAEVVEHAITHYPGLKILIFSMHPEDIYMKRFMQLGVEGYLNKSEEKKELINAVTTILNGNKYLSRRSLQLLADELRSGKSVSNPFERLSEREFVVLTYLLKGIRIKEIANMTNLHASTIGTQKQKIFSKLGIRSMKELADMARLYNFEG